MSEIRFSRNDLCLATTAAFEEAIYRQRDQGVNPEDQGSTLVSRLADSLLCWGMDPEDVQAAVESASARVIEDVAEIDML